MEQDGTYSYVPGVPPKKKRGNPKKLKSAAIIVLVVILALITVFTSYYTVDDKQQAVVTTFGRVTDITDAGVHFKLPFGIQQVRKVDVNVYQKIELGYTTRGTSYTVDEKESTMITGDYNIVDVDFFVEYKISDPVQFLYSSTDPEQESDPESGPERGRLLHRGRGADHRKGKHPDAGQGTGHRYFAGL